MKRILVLLLLVLTMSLSFGQDDIVKASIELDNNTVIAGDNLPVVLVLQIKDGWHINSSKVADEYSIPTKVTLKNEYITLKDLQYPEGEIVPISWGGNMSLYESTVRIPAVLAVNSAVKEGEQDLAFEINYQACNDVTCMSPETLLLNTKISIKAPEVSEAASENLSEPAATQQEAQLISETTEMENTGSTAIVKEEPIQDQQEKENPFQNKNILVVLLIVFVMGLALNLTPCVYPLIPITMGYFLAQKETRSPVLLAVMYVLGLAITYSIIGTLAAFGGSMMGSLLAHPATLVFFAVLMLALSLSMFGLYEFKLPNALTQVGGGSRSGAIGALIMGLTMGIVAAPCVGPFVVSLLGFVAQRGSIFIGFITFFVLALGLGLPYLFLGIFSNKINNLPRSGEWLNGIRIFFGLALIGMSIYFILPLIPGTVAGYILPVYMILAAVYYGIIDKAGLSVSWFSRLKVILAMAVLAAGILMIKPSANQVEEIAWDNYSAPALEMSIEERQPVVIDFYADWCNPCKELEHITFVDPEVVELLKEFKRFKVDLTVVNERTNALKKEFDIPGVPTIVFYDKSGNERIDLRLNGFEKPAQFKKRLEKVLAE
jgi:thiol:disulfide interchange protein DsbD